MHMHLLLADRAVCHVQGDRANLAVDSINNMATAPKLGTVLDSAPATPSSPRIERIMTRRRFQSGRVYQRDTRWVGSYREYEVNPETGKRARRTITFDA